MVKIPVFSIENIFKDKYLVQVNLDILMIPKLIYKTLHYCLIYIRSDRILKAIKDVGILINKIKVLKYHCKLYILLKLIHMIFYILLALIVCYLVKIYIDIIEYKFLSINNYRYTIHLLNRYFNYQ